MCRLLALVSCSHSPRRPLYRRSAPPKPIPDRFAAGLEKGDRGVPIQFMSPSAAGRFEPVFLRFDPLRADSLSRGSPLLPLLERSYRCMSYMATPPLCPKLDAGVAAAHNPKLDLAGIRHIPATTFS